MSSQALFSLKRQHGSFPNRARRKLGGGKADLIAAAAALAVSPQAIVAAGNALGDGGEP